ncbi:MAG: hypothetical protein LBV47_04805 [Bacteroidales bacterium]|jgi:hypothetical protein|nr:hypothetical protein [Bacteroidales bacterium]
MKNKNSKRIYGLEDDYNFNLTKNKTTKGKHLKNRLSIYDDFENDSDGSVIPKKIKKKH